MALLVSSIASAVIGAVCSWINPIFGSIVSSICNTAVMGAHAIAGMILQFKMARAFGRNDYFAVGLYFLGSVFTAILAFGDAEYKGPIKDGIGVPKLVSDLEQKATAAAAKTEGYVVFTTIYGQVQELSQKWFDDLVAYEDVNAAAKAKYTGPAMVIWGSDDEAVNPSISAATAEALGAKTVDATGEGHGYGFYSEDDAVRNLVANSTADFFSENLK